MNGQKAKSSTLGGVPAALASLVDAEMKLGSDLFRAMTGTALPQVGDVVRAVRSRASTSTGGCCQIPPPCWLPQPLGECTSHVGQCKSACIELLVTNCDAAARTITVDVPKGGAQVTVTPASVDLGPFERGTVSVCYAVPQGEADGTEHELLVWVRGCKEHYLRWTVSVGTLGLASCHQVTVEDCADYIHHWYDHFYCARRCPSPSRTTGGLFANG